LEHAIFLSPTLEDATTSTPASERAAAILYIKLLAIVVLPPLTSTPPPSERATAVDLDPASH
jgi:hypothetical protein